MKDLTQPITDENAHVAPRKRGTNTITVPPCQPLSASSRTSCPGTCEDNGGVVRGLSSVDCPRVTAWWRQSQCCSARGVPWLVHAGRGAIPLSWLVFGCGFSVFARRTDNAAPVENRNPQPKTSSLAQWPRGSRGRYGEQMACRTVLGQSPDILPSRKRGTRQLP